ncbi:RagB/SusD family nutrient uptake outer membrane protein [Polaribacter batillariae]|uniref:RagB/SusD family nutrient uptake outer membrane protein n=1 Tax=Polaribacter batillariae TaxID=2808900 RepID=A0ABX7SWI8_9FLAO|nr:RagB/SusD family nutrient uptake outer membrane protein [Polaribacter batillariae]QTD38620.1 RagB/SusD family nutrient uptake outer membrane protein [Polaribacter batillariae]
MKKLQKHIFKITTVLVFSLLTVSCDDYLSELPDNRAEINSPEKISALITGAYSQGNYQLIAEIMSDNATSRSNIRSYINVLLHEQMFTWDISLDENQDSPTFFWSNSYEAISQANQALSSIKKLEGQFNLDAQKGEALLARAYAHFMLVTFWGKQYNPSSANSDLGVPYILDPETELIKPYKRNTVQEVYDLIEKDLLEGLNLIQNREKNPKYHFSKESGAAFATRFYLQKGDWDKVIFYSNQILTNPRLQIRDVVEYSNLSYSQQTLQYSNSLEDANLLLNSTSSWWARNFWRTNYGLSFLNTEEIFQQDNPFNKNWAYGIFGSNEASNVPKFDEYFKITNQSAGTGRGYTNSVLFGFDEVLLNRAEAYTMKEDYTNAIKDLTDFLSKKTENFNPSTDILTEDMIVSLFPVTTGRLTPFYGFISDKQNSFINAILKFRQKEFYHEGMRWFDVKRFNIAIKRYYRKEDKEIELTKEDLRKQLQIPESAINFGITPNPR